MRRLPWLFWVDAALKAVLIGLLLLAVILPDLPQFEGKAMLGRAIGYPIAVFIVPVVWWFLDRRRPVAYPYDVDILFTLPFLIDVAGNALDLYDSIDWWDDANHFVNWALLSLGFGLLLTRLPLERAVVGGLTVGFGAVTAILWEYLEYVTFIRNSPELDTAYTDTLLDLAVGLSGSALAGVLTATVLWPKRKRRAPRSRAATAP
jgi:hypothetical protein